MNEYPRRTATQFRPGLIAAGLLGLAFVAFGIWFFFAPYIAWANMRRAAAAHDMATLSSYIDYPALKESLKADVNAMIASELMRNKTDNPSPSALFGAMVAGVFINQMVDFLVTPESVAMMIEGIEPSVEKASQGVSEASKPPAEPDVSMGYKGFDRFAVTVKPKDGAEKPIVLVLKRDGLISWKLAGVRLPSPGEWLPKSLAPTTPNPGDN